MIKGSGGCGAIGVKLRGTALLTDRTALVAEQVGLDICDGANEWTLPNSTSPSSPQSGQRGCPIGCEIILCMISFDAVTVTALPVDELAMAIVENLITTTKELNEYNYLNSASHDPRFRGDNAALRAIAEAFGWLRSHGLIARNPGQSADAAIFVTRAGHDAVEHRLEHVRALHRLQSGLHPLIERRARRQFLLGEYEQAIFVAMKAVEVRVRDLGAFRAIWSVLI